MCDAEVELATLRNLVEGDDSHRRSALSDYESLLAEMDRLARVARTGAKQAPTLDSKVDAYRVARALEEARVALLRQYHAYEDVAYLAIHGVERPEQIARKAEGGVANG